MKRKNVIILVLTVLLLISLLTACGRNVSFKIDFIVDRAVIHTIDTKGNEEIQLPADPEKEGYIFDGWYWDKDEWDKPFTANSLLDEPLSDDMAVHAKWLTETKYTITFESNWDIVIPAITDHGGKAITAPTISTRDGYDFGGWYTDAECKNPFDFSFMPQSNTTLYAKWTANTADPYISINGGTVNGTDLYIEVEYTATQLDLSAIISVASGASWELYKDITGSTKIPTKYASSLRNGNNIYYVVVTTNQGEVNRTYKLNIYRNHYVTMTFVSFDDIYTTEQVLTHTTMGKGPEILRTGYAFDGWGCNGHYVTKSKTFTAKWKANQATISFDANGGTGVMPEQTISSGEILPANTFIAADSDYSFLGWSTSSDGAVIYHDQDVYTVESDREQRTLYAVWVQYTRVGNYIWFGEYPQTIKSNDVTITETINSRGYYLGSDGNYYAKVTATPNNSSYKFSTNASVSSGTVYYFKVEPIKWRILSESDGTALILCESIIANKRYNEYYSGTKNGVYANNYKESEIRAWLNNEFYDTAFNALQQELIQTTNVDNSVYSTGYSSNYYACDNTNDKVFLPSYREMVNTAYGFSSSSSEYDTARRRLTSDYSRATGAYMNTSTEYYGNGLWWLRSPGDLSSGYARGINDYGYADSGNYVYYTYNGVVPALKIRLS